MPDILSCFIGKVLSEINNSKIGLHEILCNIPNPTRNSGREQPNLDVVFIHLFDFEHDFVNVIFEPKLEHNICLVKNNSFQSLEIDIASFNMIKNPTSSSYKEINSFLELVSLVWDTYSTVNRDYFELIFVVFQHVHLTSYLKCKLSRRRNHDCLDVASVEKFTLSHLLYNWQSKCKSLAWSSQVSSNQILSLVDRVKAMLLDREKALDTIFIENLNSLVRDLRKIGELGVVWIWVTAWNLSNINIWSRDLFWLFSFWIYDIKLIRSCL